MGRQGHRARLLHLRGAPQGDVAAGARRVGRWERGRGCAEAWASSGPPPLGSPFPFPFPVGGPEAAGPLPACLALLCPPAAPSCPRSRADGAAARDDILFGSSKGCFSVLERPLLSLLGALGGLFPPWEFTDAIPKGSGRVVCCCLTFWSRCTAVCLAEGTLRPLSSQQVPACWIKHLRAYGLCWSCCQDTYTAHIHSVERWVYLDDSLVKGSWRK